MALSGAKMEPVELSTYVDAMTEAAANIPSPTGDAATLIVFLVAPNVFAKSPDFLSFRLRFIDVAQNFYL